MEKTQFTDFCTGHGVATNYSGKEKTMWVTLPEGMTQRKFQSLKKGITTEFKIRYK